MSSSTNAHIELFKPDYMTVHINFNNSCSIGAFKTKQKHTGIYSTHSIYVFKQRKEHKTKKQDKHEIMWGKLRNSSTLNSPKKHVTFLYLTLFLTFCLVKV